MKKWGRKSDKIGCKEYVTISAGAGRVFRQAGEQKCGGAMDVAPPVV